jgi:hypothetical protein
LGIFPPETSIRHLEHILLSLNVPAEKLDIGSTETGSATDVLNAYRIIHEAGGLVIAAHANSTHGVAMRNFPFGGQTKIAYTQDINLDALEVTDLDRGYRSTARFFDGSKAEYPRRMHSFHGSDAHRIKADPKNPKRLGIGERASEFLLDEPSFEAVVAMLRGKQFDRTRPFFAQPEAVDTLAMAREEGPSLTQSFHESTSQRGGKLTAIVNDICAFANTAGGTIYVGAGARKLKPRGLPKPAEVQQEILGALDERMTPPLELKWEIIQSQGAKLLRLMIPKGTDRPYCVDDYKYYVRDEAETTLAVRDELVALVSEAVREQQVQVAPQQSRRDRNLRGDANRRNRGRNGRGTDEVNNTTPSGPSASSKRTVFTRKQATEPSADLEEVSADMLDGPDSGLDMMPTPVPTTINNIGSDDAFYLPQIGVEIVATEVRNGNRFHSIHDLRNGHVIHNVTRKGARKLWSYAIQQHEDKAVSPNAIEWRGDVGLVNIERRAGKVRYDLALRGEDGKIRIFYGVTDDGMEGRWAEFVQDE